MGVATGFAQGQETGADLAGRAVAQAMQAAGASVANSVLLFVTSTLRATPGLLRTACRAASCTQVMGCAAPGIFTEQQSALQTPAAAALVLTGRLALQRPGDILADFRLNLSASDAAPYAREDDLARRIGGITGTAMAVWHNGRLAPSGHVEADISGAQGWVGVAHGPSRRNKFHPVTASQGQDLVFLGGKPALLTLRQACGADTPLNHIVACVADSESAAKQGHIRYWPVLAAQQETRSVTLPQPLANGQWLCWAVRDQGAQTNQTQTMMRRLMDNMPAMPDFGLLFCSLGRGPGLESGSERDWQMLRGSLPGCPLVGFYGMGEIAPLDHGSRILQQSVVLGLFKEREIEPV